LDWWILSISFAAVIATNKLSTKNVMCIIQKTLLNAFVVSKVLNIHMLILGLIFHGACQFPHFNPAAPAPFFFADTSVSSSAICSTSEDPPVMTSA